MPGCVTRGMAHLEFQSAQMQYLPVRKGHLRLRPEEQDRLARALNLAEELGGRLVRLPGRSVAAAAVEYARAHNVTKIIVGKPGGSRWRQMLRGTVVNQLLDAGGSIDVHVISGEAAPGAGSEVAGRQPRVPWVLYAWAAVLVLLASLLGSLLRQFLAPTNLVMIYLLAVVVAALYLRYLKRVSAHLKNCGFIRRVSEVNKHVSRGLNNRFGHRLPPICL